MNTQKTDIAPRGEVIIYHTSDGQTSIDVKMENETVWLTQQQMALLFQTDRTSIVRHIKNIYASQELDKSSTCVNFAQVQTEGNRTVQRNIPFFNLDMIISVGYRVNSKRGTQFRIWANKVLKEYIIKGYAINNKLAAQKYEELSQLVQILGRTVQTQPELTNDENRELVQIVMDYNYALDTLDSYDYEQLAIADTTPEGRFHATYDNATSPSP